MIGAMRSSSSLISAVCLGTLAVNAADTNDVVVEYGVDVSFPMHHEVSVNYADLPHNVLPRLYPTPTHLKDTPIQPLGDRNAIYNDYVQGCVDKYDKIKSGQCLDYEQDRVAMNLRQPQSMVNYTETGFAKIKAPDHVWKLISEFWNRNQENWKSENWPEANTYVNHWKSPTYMVSVDDSSLRGGGSKLKQAIWDAAKETVEEWTGQELTECSLYGIRVYTEGAMLNSHVDRLPLVSSAIFNVAQDVDEPWPLEVIGHDGKAHNITMEPGDIILYESHSIVHGRPFPLKGRYMANLFVHFEPMGHSLRHHGHEDGNKNRDVRKQYKDSVKSGTGGHEAAATASTNGLPPYLIPNSPEEPNYRDHHPEAGKGSNTGLPVYALAADGKTDELMELIEEQKHLVHAKDGNGWTPLHEGARAGYVDIVRYLIEQGANIDERSHHGTGGSALFYAQKHHGAESDVFQFLKSVGASMVEPEL